MPTGKRWSKKEERVLLQGLGICSLLWLQSHTGCSYEFGDDPKGRTWRAIYNKALRMCGPGGITRGTYSLKAICDSTGYDARQVRRALAALAQKWKRTSGKGTYMIHEEQVEELLAWLKNDYWCMKYRLYGCFYCGGKNRKHVARGLCNLCWYQYRRRLSANKLPVRHVSLLRFVRKLKKTNTSIVDIEVHLKTGLALKRAMIRRLITGG